MSELAPRHNEIAGPGEHQFFPSISEAELRSITWEQCGILRSGPDLHRAYENLSNRALTTCHQPTRAHYEVRNMHQVASLIAQAALDREESRGAHYRLDFPQKSAEFERHTLLQLAEGVRGTLTLA